MKYPIEPTTLLSFIGHLLDPSIGCIEVRVFKVGFAKSSFIVADSRYPKNVSAWFERPEELLAQAKRLDGVSGYVTLNPVRSDLLARANYLVKCDHATKDEDIVALNWLYLDFDPTRAVHACIAHEPACRNQPRMSWMVTPRNASPIAL
jgi:hypothetical protein